ncbi:FecR family protein [Hyphomonas sp.]|uniref:FecR family protein n=1 Tax=Hyphomonas sp. TaxID=87 RepID=UPI003919A466
MTTPARDKDVQTAAARWDARLRNPQCTEADRDEFLRWLAADPAHEEAFEQLRQSITALRQVANRPDLSALRAAALRQNGSVSGRSMALVAALVVAAVAFPMGVILTRGPAEQPPLIAAEVPPSAHETAIGQRASITLEDGSVVTLNTDSRIEVGYTAGERLITLHKGQALFEVAHDEARPFSVVAGGQRVIALGTVFDVRLSKTAVEVVLVDGKVAIAGKADPEPRAGDAVVHLTSGERYVALLAAAAPEVSQVDTSKATSWSKGFVTFDDTPLAEALAEMNRYSTVQIIAEEEALTQLRVTGMFRSGQQARFAEALEAYFPLEAERDGDTIVLKISHPS